MQESSHYFGFHCCVVYIIYSNVRMQRMMYYSVREEGILEKNSNTSTRSLT